MRISHIRVRSYLSLAVVASVIGACAMPALGQADVPDPTQVMVRAVSRDAKIIGSGVGGSRIVVQEATTGRVLAEGIQSGSTGSTTSIMVSPARRDSTRFDTEGAAGFLAELSITKPTVVDISAYGPLGTPAAIVRSSKRMLVVPGQHVLGEGVILELNGFTVELTEATAAMGKLSVGARVTMLCGCPTEPGGMWNSNQYEISATLESGGRQVAKKRMVFGGKTSTYTTTFENVASGVYDLHVVAADKARGNFGMASGTAIIP